MFSNMYLVNKDYHICNVDTFAGSQSSNGTYAADSCC